MSVLNQPEKVIVVINNYHGYWEYGVSAFLPWNTAEAIAQRVATAMLSYGDMGLGTWYTSHKGKGVWNVPLSRNADHMIGDYYPNLWQGALANMDYQGNNRALRYKDRSKFVFVVDNGEIREATDIDLAEVLGGKR